MVRYGNYGGEQNEKPRNRFQIRGGGCNWLEMDGGQNSSRLFFYFFQCHSEVLPQVFLVLVINSILNAHYISTPYYNCLLSTVYCLLPLEVTVNMIDELFSLSCDE